MDSSASLDALCDQLARATSARKVLVCAEDGSILAHAGERGVLTSQISAELANLVAQILVETQIKEQASSLEAERDLDEDADPELGRGMNLDPDGAAGLGPMPMPTDDRYTRVGRLHVCAAPLANRALLIVLFDDATEIGQVRVRVRRARPLMLRVLTSTNQIPAI